MIIQQLTKTQHTIIVHSFYALYVALLDLKLVIENSVLVCSVVDETIGSGIRYTTDTDMGIMCFHYGPLWFGEPSRLKQCWS